MARVQLCQAVMFEFQWVPGGGGDCNISLKGLYTCHGHKSPDKV